ncbi:MAG: IS4 family transposase, partial [Methylococcales bacterium]|nr:IS4 family transposase [Methylococcales bacterium]
MFKRKRAVDTSRGLIEDNTFKERHRWSEKDFTRLRVLSFELVLVLVLRNSVKSLQLVVNEAMNWLNQDPVTASAYSQARYKLKHTAFIELNQKAVVDTMYADKDYQRFWGYRILAVDGSKIRLPDNDEICEEFGTLTYSNGKDSTIQGEHPYALASVLYDVLNRVALTAELAATDAYEVDLAIAHLTHTTSQDLLVMDRNYPSYRMLAELEHRNREFVIRCSGASFGVARQMLKGEGADSQIVTLTPCAKQVPLLHQRGLSQSLTVRFVRVKLETGEWEVLVTSLRDEVCYPTKEFKELYYFRWGIETFYGLIKTRLELENFTGIGVEAVRQDFFSTLYLSGLESLLTEPAQDQLSQKDTVHPQIVNRAVSFNAIKDQALALLFLSELESDVLLERLTALFMMNPCLERKGR